MKTLTGLTATAILLLTTSIHAATSTQTVDLDGVDDLYFAGDVEVVLTQGNNNEAVVEFDEKDKDKVDISVSGSKFVIKRNSGFWDFWRHSDSVKVTVVAELENLASMEISGATKVRAGDINAEELRVKASGASEFNIGSIEAEELHIGLSGASNVALGDVAIERMSAHLSGASRIEANGTGTAQSLRIEASGASHFVAKDVVASDVSVHASGASNMTLNASDHLKVNLSGASNLRYGGAPSTDIHTSGASNISTF
ncbi:DUF2807 domain-containing protein [Gilvimarinus sp. SDUM040013]|uniref:DUF2807 domain-containing protein n=1 Tax=Gilvimarinus gilvus TaxID=3058038 RepID=A0ABU4RZB9_9GAMM|nr:DUF2807 domain-containing protein [Gilvimarinus sp. SDUM040013]MDO3384659.1 DUF2807 domain-containing protein [Gilvimarinus sp. SDUM040013]MDX6850245.1 DUF2807 domain-containing protein [Gilvimarinus sp. SDUM040013]